MFEVDISTINEHLKNIYNNNELEKKATIGKFPIVQKEGSREVKRIISFYNLDAIISVGYRVNSIRATQFRQWATKILKDISVHQIQKGQMPINHASQKHQVFRFSIDYWLIKYSALEQKKLRSRCKQIEMGV